MAFGRFNWQLWVLALVLVISQPARADKKEPQLKTKTLSSFSTYHDGGSKIPQLSEVELPSTSAQMLVQSRQKQANPPSQGAKQTGIISITGVKANPTDKGLEVILQTAQGEQLQVTNRSTGNNFVADISGGQLRLPSGEAFAFRSEKPLAGVTEITVTNVDANTVRVTVVGEASQPTVELFDDDTGLVFGVAGAATAAQPQPEAPQATEKPATEAPQEEPAAQQDDPIELVVTGEQDGYRAPNASTATRTDTPIRDIPQSIQVVPQEVLRDRNVRDLTEAVETVAGVVEGGDRTVRIIRGFSQSGNFRNGFRDVGAYGVTAARTIEQVEVLRGPASVLFGQVEPGGIINVTTRQPLSTPYYNLAFEVGNYNLYQPSIDLSGPLTTDKNLLYRLIASYKNSNPIPEPTNIQETVLAPSITWKLGDRTDLKLYYEYSNTTGDPFWFYTGILSDGSLLPRNFFQSYPSLARVERTTQRYGYELNHKLTDNWQIRNNFSVAATNNRQTDVFATEIENDRILTGFVISDYRYKPENYFGQIDLLGRFNTGAISHQLLIGFDFNRLAETFQGFEGGVPDLDIFNPNYNVPVPANLAPYTGETNTQSYGVYLQDQITIFDNLKLLIGGRVDWTEQSRTFVFDNVDFLRPDQNDTAFSPRIGLVYQPSDLVAFYASYSRSFLPTTGFNPDGRVFDPTRGTQYEVGVKADWLNRKLSTTLAAYQITKTNVTTTDPNNPTFSIQTGEQQSQGIELDVAGEILPGLKLIASYAYTDAKVTQDNTTPVGNRLNGVPENQASLWTTYEIQQGDLKGLGFGLGLFYVGERQGDLANSFQLKDYLRTDAALYYRRDGFKAAINIRNLFDIDYAEYGSGRTFIQRGAPLTITGSVSLEF